VVVSSKHQFTTDEIKNSYSECHDYTIRDGKETFNTEGDYNFVETSFEKSKETTAAKSVYILCGPSGIGKSHLASMIGNQSLIYETDARSQLADDLSMYDVIVMGNKHQFTVDEIKDRYVGTDKDCNFIIVRLSCVHTN
jgi:chromosomal replication initiation ATPase DnaA